MACFQASICVKSSTERLFAALRSFATRFCSFLRRKEIPEGRGTGWERKGNPRPWLDPLREGARSSAGNRALALECLESVHLGLHSTTLEKPG